MNKKIQLLLISLMLLFTLAAGTGTLPLFNPFLQTDMNGGDAHGPHSITNLNTLSASNVSASATMSLNGQTISNWPVASTNFSLVNGVPGAVSFSGAGVQTNSPGNYTILAGAATNASLVNNTPGSVTLQGSGIVTNGGGVFTITGGAAGGVTTFNGLSNNVGYTVAVVASNAFTCYLQTNSPTLQFYLTVDTNYATTNWVVSLGYATTGQLASQGANLTNYVVGLGYVTAAVTNGLATQAYVQVQTNTLFNWVVAQNYVTASVTNGLATQAYVQVQTNAVYNWVLSQAYVTAAVTNGLATQVYVQALTNAQWSLSLNTFQYGSTTLSNLVLQMPAVINGGGITNLVIPMTNYTGTSGTTGLYGVTNALGQLWISNYFNTALTNGLAAWNTLTNGTTEGYIWQYHAGALQWINTNWENGFVQNATNLMWQSLGTAAQSNAVAFQATNGQLTTLAANAAAFSVWGNLTGSSAAASYTAGAAGQGLFWNGWAVDTNLTAAAPLSIAAGIVSLPANLVTLNTNNGANLTNLNASNLASGTVPTNVLPGSLPDWSRTPTNSLAAISISSGTLADARLPVDVVTTNQAGQNSVNIFTTVGTGLGIANTGPTNTISLGSILANLVSQTAQAANSVLFTNYQATNLIDLVDLTGSSVSFANVTNLTVDASYGLVVITNKVPVLNFASLKNVPSVLHTVEVVVYCTTNGQGVGLTNLWSARGWLTNNIVSTMGVSNGSYGFSITTIPGFTNSTLTQIGSAPPGN